MIYFEATYSHDGKYSNGGIELEDNEIKISHEKVYEKQKSVAVKLNRKDMWVRPQLKVRFIDKRFKVIMFFVLEIF